MSLLLDTHTFLWFVLNDPRLPASARDLIADAENTIFLSPATSWEIAIKISLGKYSLPGSFAEFMDDQIARNNLVLLPITVAHAAITAALPFHRRDPFDRLLVAQAIAEDIPLLSGDVALDSYPVRRLW